jgi:alpha-L-rhamnosidase
MTACVASAATIRDAHINPTSSTTTPARWRCTSYRLLPFAPLMSGRGPGLQLLPLAALLAAAGGESGALPEQQLLLPPQHRPGDGVWPYIIPVPPVALTRSSDDADDADDPPAQYYAGATSGILTFVSAVGIPKLQWQIGECIGCTGIRQTGFQLTILQGSSGTIMWDSGFVNTAEMAVQRQVHGGSALSWDSRYVYHLRVAAVDADGHAYGGSTVGRFATTIATVDWTASQWIGGGTRLRHDFSLSSSAVTSATAYVSGVGCAMLSVNSVSATDALLEPGWANLPTVRMPYRAYDVSHLLRAGTINTIGIKLGMCHYGYVDAFCVGAHASNANCRALRLVLTVRHASGRVQTVASRAGHDWQQTSTADPIRYSHLYHGEVFDARLEQVDRGWDSPGRNRSSSATSWAPSVTYAGADKEFGRATMSLAQYPPVVVTESRQAASFHAVQITPNPENRSIFVYNFSQNIAGIASLQLKPGDAKAGDMFVLKYAEMLVEPGMTGFANGSGSVAMAFCHWRGINDTASPQVGPTLCPGAGPFMGNTANQTDLYIASGKCAIDGESFVPTFTYKGFRFVQLEGPAGFVPTADTLTAHFLHSNVSKTGDVHFHSVANNFNRLQTAVQYTQLSNLVHTPTDCPHR